LGSVASAQESDPTVQWSVSIRSGAGLKHGSKATLELSADIADGWHVYALTEPPGGPTALRISLDDNDTAQASGIPSGAPPTKKHDASFNLDTQIYTHAFVLQLPLQVKQHAGAGRQLIPISVRYQSCSDRECRPPKTVKLQAALDVVPDT
jgi:hypothetical protein